MRTIIRTEAIEQSYLRTQTLNSNRKAWPSWPPTQTPPSKSGRKLLSWSCGVSWGVIPGRCLKVRYPPCRLSLWMMLCLGQGTRRSEFILQTKKVEYANGCGSQNWWRSRWVYTSPSLCRCWSLCIESVSFMGANRMCTGFSRQGDGGRHSVDEGCREGVDGEKMKAKAWGGVRIPEACMVWRCSEWVRRQSGRECLFFKGHPLFGCGFLLQRTNLAFGMAHSSSNRYV